MIRNLKLGNSRQVWDKVLGTQAPPCSQLYYPSGWGLCPHSHKIATKAPAIRLMFHTRGRRRVKGKSLTWHILLNYQWQETHHVVTRICQGDWEMYLVGHVAIPNNIRVLLVKKNGGHRIGNCLFLPQGCLLNKNQQMPIRESFFISLGSLQYIVGETSMPYNLIININKFLKISRHIKSHFYVCLIEKEVFNLKRYIFVIKPNLGPFACPQ